jgi:hypothetical protein
MCDVTLRTLLVLKADRLGELPAVRLGLQRVNVEAAKGAAAILTSVVVAAAPKRVPHRESAPQESAKPVRIPPLPAYLAKTRELQLEHIKVFLVRHHQVYNESPWRLRRDHRRRTTRERHHRQREYRANRRLLLNAFPLSRPHRRTNRLATAEQAPAAVVDEKTHTRNPWRSRHHDQTKENGVVLCSPSIKAQYDPSLKTAIQMGTKTDIGMEMDLKLTT